MKKAWQNKGVGTLLLRKAIEIADLENIFVAVHVMNYNNASQKLFLNLGFKKTDEDKNTSNGFYFLNRKGLKKH